MDKNDVILCQLLLANSRMPYRELAEKLDLSVTAVHNRIQSMIDLGIIRRFNTTLSLIAKPAIHILIYGTSKTNSINNLKTKLAKQGSIYWLAVAGGNSLYIGAYLKHLAELDGLVRFVRENAEMPEVTVGLTNSPIPPNITAMNIKTKLCELDYKIIRALKDNSRKATADIAEEVGASAKTVSRRLAYMTKNFLVQFSIDWYPDVANDIMSVFHINLKNDSNPNSANQILQKHYPNTLFYWSFSNIPNSYFFMVWTPTSKELKETRETIEQNPAVQFVVPNVIYAGSIFPIWRDEIP